MEEVFGVIVMIGIGIWLLHFWQVWAVVITFLIWRYHPQLAEFYYSLTPHPAATMLDRRLAENLPIDGETFAEIMAEQPGNAIEQRVRGKQALKLAATARAAVEANLKTLERMKAAALKDAEFTAAQAELAGAVEAHERIAAQIEAVEQWRANNVAK